MTEETKVHPAIKATAIELHPVQTYEVRRLGEKVGVYHASQRWEGMIKLTDDKGHVIVADAPSDLVGGFFGPPAFLSSTATVHVLRASPDVIDQLQQIKPKDQS